MQASRLTSLAALSLARLRLCRILPFSLAMSFFSSAVRCRVSSESASSSMLLDLEREGPGGWAGWTGWTGWGVGLRCSGSLAGSPVFVGVAWVTWTCTPGGSGWIWCMGRRDELRTGGVGAKDPG